MGNWASRQGTEGGWETYWDENASESPGTMTYEDGSVYTQQQFTDAEGNTGYQWVQSAAPAAAPKTWQDIALGNWQEARDSNGNSLVSQLSQLRPGYDWTNEIQQSIANHNAAFGSGWTQWSSVPAIVNDIASRAGMQNPYSQQQIQQSHDSLVSSHAAANQDDDGFLGLGDLGTLLAIGGSIYGLGSLAGVFGGLGSAGAAGAGLLDTVLPAELFAGGAAASGGAGALGLDAITAADIGAYGGFGDLASMGGAEALSGAGTAGLDAITAADMAAGDAMLGGMGQDYGTFLGDLANGGVAGTANLDTVLPTQGTTVPTGQAATTTLPPGGGTLANVVGSGDIEDAQLGSDMLKNSGQTYEQFLNALKTGGAYQFPWGQVIGAVMEAYGQDNYRDDLLEVMNRAITESDPFRTQRPRYFEPLYQAATQGVGGTPYGEAIANSTLRKLSSTGDAGYDITGLGANTLAKNLNSASLDYVKALTPLTGAGFQANTGAATNVGQQAAQAGMGQSGALGSAFSSIMNGNQPSSLERLFGGKQANQTFPQFLASF